MTQENSYKLYVNIATALLFSIALISAVLFSPVFAQNADDIEFPVAELGNCESEEECKSYCDDSDNISQCIDFAEAHNLMSGAEIERARALSSLGVFEGPGGCRSEDECENYCEDAANIQECILFARDHGLMPEDEIEEAEKVLQALESGATLPGGCTDKESCELYCEDTAHLDECLAFAEAAGFMSPEEAEMARKTGGKGPGGCKGKGECDAYCESGDHMKECILFAKKYDLMSPDELREVDGVLRALESGVPMPDCKGKDDCEIYCSGPLHAEECFDFAVAAGFIADEDVEMTRKMFERGITEGPGGCKSKEDCESFCDNPDNLNECMEFSVRAGMMTQEEFEHNKERMMRGGPGGCTSEDECQAYCEEPDHMDECMEAAVEEGMMTREEVERKKEEMMRAREFEMEHMFEDGDVGDFRENIPEEFRDFIPHEDDKFEDFKREDFGDGSMREEMEHQIREEMIQKRFDEEFKKRMEKFNDPGGMMPPEGFVPEMRDEPTGMGPQNMLGLILAPFMNLFK